MHQKEILLGSEMGSAPSALTVVHDDTDDAGAP